MDFRSKNPRAAAVATVPLDGAAVRYPKDLLVRVMRAGLLAEIATLLNERTMGGGMEAAPIGIMRSMVDCRAYGMVRLSSAGALSPALAGVVAVGDSHVAPVQALRFPVRGDERWADDTDLCGFDLRRIRDRLLEQPTPCGCGAWPRRWVPGYGPDKGFRDTLLRGCITHLDAMTATCGEPSALWRRLEVPSEMATAVLEDERFLPVSALRVGEGYRRDGEYDLMAFVGDEGHELWRRAVGLPLEVLLPLVRVLASRMAAKGFVTVMP